MRTLHQVHKRSGMSDTGIADGSDWFAGVVGMSDFR
jgi:hypothetical protein